MQLVEGPVHLLRPSEDHSRLVPDAAAMKMLEEIGELSVLSLVGNQRGGKSTLMNLLHGRKLSGFSMGHYMDPQTAGLWVWPIEHPRKPGVCVLLVDSEGLDSPHIPEHYNWVLSAVALLVADVFMYQSKGSIEQSQADRLDMILRVSEQLDRRGHDERAAGNFIWLLRDHQLQMRRSPKEELLEKLPPQAISTLRRSFYDFDCIPLPRPVQDEAMLSKLDTMEFNDLSSTFREEFIVFERRLMDILQTPRQLLGQPLSGSGLASLIKQYTHALGNREGVLSDICQMPTQRQLLDQMAGERAVKAAVSVYEQTMNSADLEAVTSAKVLITHHSTASSAAEEHFNKEAQTCGLGAKERAVFLEQLKNAMAEWEELHTEVAGSPSMSSDGGVGVREERVLAAGKLHDFWQKIMPRSDAACTAAWDKLWISNAAVKLMCVDQESRQGPGELDDLWTAFLAARKGLSEEALGPARHARLRQLTDEHMKHAAQHVLQYASESTQRLQEALASLREENKHSFQEEQAARTKLQSHADNLEERLTKQEQKVSETLADIESRMGASAKDLAHLGEEVQRQVTEMQKALQQSEQTTTNALRQVTEDSMRQVSELRQALHSSEQRSMEAISELRRSLGAELGSSRSAWEERIAKLGEEISQAKLHTQTEFADVRRVLTDECRDNLASAKAALEEKFAKVIEDVSQLRLQSQTEINDVRRSLADDKRSLADDFRESLSSSRTLLEEKISKVSEDQSQTKVQGQTELANTKAVLEERVGKIIEEQSQARLQAQTEITELRSKTVELQTTFEKETASLTEGQCRIQTAMDAAQKLLKEEQIEAQSKVDSTQKKLVEELQKAMESVKQQQQEYFNNAEDALESRLGFITGKQDQLSKGFEKLATETQEQKSILEGLNLETRLAELREGIASTKSTLGQEISNSVAAGQAALESRLNTVCSDIEGIRQGIATACLEVAAAAEASSTEGVNELKRLLMAQKGHSESLENRLGQVTTLQQTQTERVEQRLKDLQSSVEAQQSHGSEITFLKSEMLRLQSLGQASQDAEEFRRRVQKDMEQLRTGISQEVGERAIQSERAAQRVVADEVNAVRSVLLEMLDAMRMEMESLKQQLDVDSIWESFAQLGGRLADIQQALDSHKAKNPR
eukprot:gnl/MRDRNA2_/MRDRNA2_73681_c0_seq1.p1 gnl/MRDRNA2_/MRDRNA2_73681_c0~~gnl/MRDRNA2_/MRDRNA2_73681_c0_seq1.p1  ORF type:complete len:1148 (+),score=294.58 gnl/MRDRNA2_/MRDRNA2_73681_c0_seq1:112-3555(+)